jgi:hypothetical protein
MSYCHVSHRTSVIGALTTKSVIGWLDTGGLSVQYSCHVWEDDTRESLLMYKVQN